MYSIHEMKELKGSGNILSGKDIFIGSDAKTRNTKVLHVEFPYSCANYRFFNVGKESGGFNSLARSVFALDVLINGNIPENEKENYFASIMKELYIVHHKDTINKKGQKRNSKLAGINSLSTSCMDNAICIARMKNSCSICSHCYSATQQSAQSGLMEHNIINGLILKNIVIPVHIWQKYFDKRNLSMFFRFESFGDVENVNVALNYINLMLAFPGVHFTAWTKNSGIWRFAFLQSCKPDNMVFIVSSDKINETREVYGNMTQYVDHVFTVFDSDYIAENNVAINCGGRKCMDCIKAGKRCYFRNTEYHIHEQLK